MQRGIARKPRSALLDIMRYLYRISGRSLDKIYSAKCNDVMDPQSANLLLRARIESGKPFMASRLGTSEADVMLNYLEILKTKDLGAIERANYLFQGARPDWSGKAAELLCRNAGFFPCLPEALERFAAMAIDSLTLSDCMAVWGFVPGEDFLLGRFCPDSVRCNAGALEPYYFETPWSAVLRGKRILVVHPFVATMRDQYERREMLFANADVLPEFDLLTIPAVQSLAGASVSFSSWFEALDWMKSQIDKLHFDVALIGAGAFGLPLAAYIKRKGKIAVHIGGSLQIMFGIKGRRWDSMPAINRFYNDYWVRPSKQETPDLAGQVEAGCYW